MVPGLAGWVALIGIAEKGFISLELTTEQKGGHSMAPPPQTSLGILATAISKLQNNLFPLRWTEAVKEQYQCLGAEMPFPMKMMFANMWLFGPLIMKKLTAVAQTAASLRTTTAPTMFRGSPQDNVLPMRASAVVNFRILQGDTTQSVIDRVKRLINDPRVTISTYGNNNSEPSPVASLNSRSYGIINRTTREVLGDVLVIPTLVLGKTDSIKFAGLAECCYRYVPQRMTVAEIGAVHGFNERISIDNYTEMISFFIRLLHNSCE
jgi:carboxypeptidase PM20D1